MSSDFCGFTFNQHHSSEMGILRVSDGSRYTINLTPSLKDKTMEIPGGDGMYFFESFYTSSPFSISIAFDSVTESQMRLMRQVFNGKDIGPLIFDETPYKAYIVKVQSPPQLKFVCFDEKDSNNISHRVYKGEGTIQFIAYSPYAQSTRKFANEFNAGEFPNVSEWIDSTGMVDNTNNHYDLIAPATYIVNLFNPGDVPTDFKAFIPFSVLNCGLSLQILGDQSRVRALNISPITQKINSTDQYICINSKTNLIEGYDSYNKPTGSVYNKYIVAGDFFKIPVYTNTTSDLTLNAFPYTDQGTQPYFSGLEYNYLYY